VPLPPWAIRPDDLTPRGSKPSQTWAQPVETNLKKSCKNVKINSHLFYSENSFRNLKTKVLGWKYPSARQVLRPEREIKGWMDIKWLPFGRKKQKRKSRSQSGSETGPPIPTRVLRQCTQRVVLNYSLQSASQLKTSSQHDHTSLRVSSTPPGHMI
jgi:hypothetical protein